MFATHCRPNGPGTIPRVNRLDSVPTQKTRRPAAAVISRVMSRPWNRTALQCRSSRRAGLGERHRRGHHGRGDVSLRTFGNYFSSKYEAICAIGTTLLARPADEPLREAISNAVLAHYEGAGQAPDGEWMARLKLVLAAPAIRGEYLKINSEMQEALAEAIATRTGTDIEQDMYPRILAGAVIAAAQSRLGGGPPPTRPCRSGRCCGERSSSSRRPALGWRPAGERGRVQGTGRPRRSRPNGCGCTPPVRRMPGLVI
jgi:hypothetical protein